MYDKVKVIEQMLDEYKLNEIDIANIELEIEELKEISLSVASNFEQKTSKTNRIQRTVEDDYINREEKIKNLIFIRNKLERNNKKIENALKGLKERKKNIIELKYMEYRGKSWGFIAKKADLSEAWARKLKDQAIKEMAAIIFRHS